MPRARGDYHVLHNVVSTHESRPDRHYQIRQGQDGIVYCTCPGWRFRRTCRHLTEYLRPRPERTASIRPATPAESARLDRERARIDEIAAEERQAESDRPRPDLVTEAYSERMRELGIHSGTLRVKKWKVYDGTKLLGQVSGTSKEDVLSKITTYNGIKSNITVKDNR